MTEWEARATEIAKVGVEEFILRRLGRLTEERNYWKAEAERLCRANAVLVEQVKELEGGHAP
ncbi:MAG: hypothetical protein KGL39_08100 [Patescibacteria group bacterium]|nr:hypothetical protein [Patescibacteria group bacterium]